MEAEATARPQRPRRPAQQSAADLMVPPPLYFFTPLSIPPMSIFYTAHSSIQMDRISAPARRRGAGRRAAAAAGRAAAAKGGKAQSSLHTRAHMTHAACLLGERVGMG